MVAGDVVAMMVFHVDDIKIAATEKVTEVVVSALNQRFPTKHLGEVEWYMGRQEGSGERYFGDFSDSVHSERTESLWCFENPAPSPQPLPWTSGT